MSDNMNTIFSGDVKDIGQKLGKHKRTALILAAVVLLLIVVFNSFFILESGEHAIIIRLGSHRETVVSPGLHMKLPFIDEAHTVSVQTLHILEFGYRSVGDGPYSYRDVDREAIMLTGDEDLVVASWAIQYQIRDPFLALFRVEDLETTLRVLTESSYRRVVASHSLDAILTEQKDLIQLEVQTDLQALCDSYNTGVLVRAVLLQDAMPPDAVRPAFLDVISAREERETRTNEAHRYANERLPVARGDAERMINEAMGYHTRRINEAEGEVARYLAIQAEYATNPEITMTRLYLEMIRDVMPQLKSVTIVDDGDLLKFLPIGDGLLER